MVNFLVTLVTVSTDKFAITRQPDYNAFEHLCVYVQGSGFNTLVVVVYRPGSETVTDAFFVSLTDLLWNER